MFFYIFFFLFLPSMTILLNLRQLRMSVVWSKTLVFLHCIEKIHLCFYSLHQIHEDHFPFFTVLVARSFSIAWENLDFIIFYNKQKGKLQIANFTFHSTFPNEVVRKKIDKQKKETLAFYTIIMKNETQFLTMACWYQLQTLDNVFFRCSEKMLSKWWITKTKKNH